MLIVANNVKITINKLNTNLSNQLSNSYKFTINGFIELSVEKIIKTLLKNFPDILFIKMMIFFDSNPSKKHVISQPKFRYNNINLFLSGFNSACIKFVRSTKIVKFLEDCDHAADVY